MSGPVFPPAAQRPRSFIILIVEENADFAQFLEEVINAQTPYQAVVVASGLCALEQARSLQPCLLLLDYHLSDMNGLEVFDRLQQMEETRGTPAIMMSADLPYEALERRGIYPLRRPTDRRRVVRVITHALASNEEQQLARSQQTPTSWQTDMGQGSAQQSLARARSS